MLFIHSLLLQTLPHTEHAFLYSPSPSLSHLLPEHMKNKER